MNKYDALDYAMQKNKVWWNGMLVATFLSMVFLTLAFFSGAGTAASDIYAGRQPEISMFTDVCFFVGALDAICALIYFVIWCKRITSDMSCKDTEDFERYKEDVRKGKYGKSAIVYEESTMDEILDPERFKPHNWKERWFGFL